MQILHRLLEIVGGVAVIGGGLWVFSSNLIRDYFKTRWKSKADIETDEAKGLNAIKRIQPEQYAHHQFEVCVELWKTLASLRSAVDLLWESVTEENILSLNNQIRDTHKKIYAWSLFFEEGQVQLLDEAMNALGNFSAGKPPVYEMNSPEYQGSQDFLKLRIQEQIAENGRYKERFELLVTEMQNSLRNKFQGHVSDEDIPA